MAIPHLLWDASAASKRYVPEPGDDTVDVLFSLPTAHRSAMTFTGYGEMYAILRRRRNAGHLSQASFVEARAAMEEELIYGDDFEMLSTGDSMILAGLPLIDRHNLNSSDATILAAYIEYNVSLPTEDAICVLVASDRRLLRAAGAEGLATLDPEILRPEDVGTFLRGL